MTDSFWTGGPEAYAKGLREHYKPQLDDLRGRREGADEPERAVIDAEIKLSRFLALHRRTTWFLRKAAASSLERRLVCQIDRFGHMFWIAAPRTPPLWQRGFFLINCLVLRDACRLR